MNRTTKEIITPGNHKIVIKEYLTYEEIEATFKLTDNEEKSKKIIELALVSVDGISENAVALARQLPVRDYTILVKEVTIAAGGDFQPVKSA